MTNDEDALDRRIEEHAGRINDALRQVVADPGMEAEQRGLMGRWCLVVEFIRPDGKQHLRTWRAPGMAEWDEHGMLFSALYVEGEDPLE